MKKITISLSNSEASEMAFFLKQRYGKRGGLNILLKAAAQEALEREARNYAGSAIRSSDSLRVARLEKEARKKITDLSELRQYESLIFDHVDNPEQHFRWILQAPVEDIQTWAEMTSNSRMLSQAKKNGSFQNLNHPV